MFILIQKSKHAHYRSGISSPCMIFMYIVIFKFIIIQKKYNHQVIDPCPIDLITVTLKLHKLQVCAKLEPCYQSKRKQANGRVTVKSTSCIKVWFVLKAWLLSSYLFCFILKFSCMHARTHTHKQTTTWIYIGHTDPLFSATGSSLNN